MLRQTGFEGVDALLLELNHLMHLDYKSLGSGMKLSPKFSVNIKTVWQCNRIRHSVDTQLAGVMRELDGRGYRSTGTKSPPLN